MWNRRSIKKLGKDVENNKNEHKRQGKETPLIYIYCDKIGHHIIGIFTVISRHKKICTWLFCIKR